MLVTYAPKGRAVFTSQYIKHKFLKIEEKIGKNRFSAIPKLDFLLSFVFYEFEITEKVPVTAIKYEILVFFRVSRRKKQLIEKIVKSCFCFLIISNYDRKSFLYDDVFK